MDQTFNSILVGYKNVGTEIRKINISHFGLAINTYNTDGVTGQTVTLWTDQLLSA